MSTAEQESCAPGMLHPPVTPEHEWLQRLIGDWVVTDDAGDTGIGDWTESVRAIGDYWIHGEGHGTMPGGGTATMLITLGYDPRRGRFVGTWCGSMMTHMFVYEGSLDPTGRILALDTTGPDMTDPTRTSRYRDTITIVDADTREFRGELMAEDGSWKPLMKAIQRRRR